MLRGKAPVDEINDKSAAFISSATNDSTTEAEAISLNEDIITQALLQIGSKSFSHFLNILERYLQLFKALASTSEKRRSLINTVWTFFSSQKQMGIIVLDKLLRYRVLDPKDVVAYIFDIDPVAWSDINTWDLLTNTIDVAQSRIANALTKLDSLRAAAAVKAAEDEEQKQSAATDGNSKSCWRL